MGIPENHTLLAISGIPLVAQESNQRNLLSVLRMISEAGNKTHSKLPRNHKKYTKWALKALVFTRALSAISGLHFVEKGSNQGSLQSVLPLAKTLIQGYQNSQKRAK